MKTYPWEPDWAVHPSQHVAETMTERGLSPLTFAMKLGVPLAAVHRLLSGEDRIGVHWAQLLNGEFGVSIEFWLALQANYDAAIKRGAKDNDGPARLSARTARRTR